MKNNKINRDKISKQLEKFAKRYMEDGMDRFPGEKDMERMFKADYKDFMKIAKAIKENKLKSAGKYIDNLDTVPRESIPQTVFDLVKEHSWWADRYSN